MFSAILLAPSKYRAEISRNVTRDKGVGNNSARIDTSDWPNGQNFTNNARGRSLPNTRRANHQEIEG